ncbi:MAG: type II secretion system minor pseudopilin GspI [Xanthomonadales bacterium]|nr:type II secretion system minor pseudopilin GspI [Xanthomonadales bacterium]
MRRGGFLLLEVLLAVAVLAIALAALLQTAVAESRVLGDQRERLLARLVAANALEELRLAEPFPAPGRRAGRARMAGTEWELEIAIEGTEEPSLRRVEVTAFRAGGGGVRVRLHGVFAEP